MDQDLKHLYCIFLERPEDIDRIENTDQDAAVFAFTDLIVLEDGEVATYDLHGD